MPDFLGRKTHAANGDHTMCGLVIGGAVTTTIMTPDCERCLSALRAPRVSQRTRRQLKRVQDFANRLPQRPSGIALARAAFKGKIS